MIRSCNIIIAEPSVIVSEGLAGILSKSGFKCNISLVGNIDELQNQYLKRKCELIIINPSLVQNSTKSFHLQKKQFDGVQWVGLVYAYFDYQVLSVFDSVINISDSPETISGTLHKVISNNIGRKDQNQEVLSERETDVLKLLATGLSNKEIADKLNISINTVITHRKNITQKTGIKTVSGLTIYAVIKKLISLENVEE